MTSPNPEVPRPLSTFAAALDWTLEASVIGSFSSIGPALRRPSAHWSALAPTPGRVVVVTGASSGLGRQAACELGALGCHVIAVGRDLARLDDVVDEITSAGGSAESRSVDLADLDATRALAAALNEELDRLDVLIHNAGALLSTYSTGPQGFETTVTVHLLSPALLTEALRPALDRAERAKVITMTSGGMYTEAFDLSELEMSPASYKGTTAYARAKRAQVVLTRALQRREPPSGIDFHLVHPGWARTPGVSTSLPTFATVLGPILRTPADGVDTMVWLATLPPGVPRGGQLWLDRRPRAIAKTRSTRVDDATEITQGDALLEWIDERIGASD